MPPLTLRILLFPLSEKYTFPLVSGYTLFGKFSNAEVAPISPLNPAVPAEDPAKSYTILL